VLLRAAEETQAPRLMPPADAPGQHRASFDVSFRDMVPFGIRDLAVLNRRANTTREPGTWLQAVIAIAEQQGPVPDLPGDSLSVLESRWPHLSVPQARSGVGPSHARRPCPTAFLRR
jgi:hypothetical protein